MRATGGPLVVRGCSPTTRQRHRTCHPTGLVPQIEGTQEPPVEQWPRSAPVEANPPLSELLRRAPHGGLDGYSLPQATPPATTLVARFELTADPHQGDHRYQAAEPPVEEAPAVSLRVEQSYQRQAPQRGQGEQLLRAPKLQRSKVTGLQEQLVLDVPGPKQRLKFRSQPVGESSPAALSESRDAPWTEARNALGRPDQRVARSGRHLHRPTTRG
ncbi:unannotated protein [freshwater metagenome]|uniref:Unannotated protein n=1 Tax=freshwater metagenome TaxID=449393 RepID=A0A6J6PUQ7_9ZZZZ